MTKGRIVLVPFPFDDLSATKVRPAACLIDPVGPYRHVILAFITTNTKHPLLNTDILLSDQHLDFTATKLPETSVLRLSRLLTVRTSFIRQELGELSPAWQAEVSEKLKAVFGL